MLEGLKLERIDNSSERSGVLQEYVGYGVEVDLLHRNGVPLERRMSEPSLANLRRRSLLLLTAKRLKV